MPNAMGLDSEGGRDGTGEKMMTSTGGTSLRSRGEIIICLIFQKDIKVSNNREPADSAVPRQRGRVLPGVFKRLFLVLLPTSSISRFTLVSLIDLVPAANTCFQ